MAGLSPQTRSWIRMAIDYAAPAVSLIAFFRTHDFEVATWWLVGFSALAITGSLILERRFAPLPIIYGGMALVFGGLTLVFHDKVFVKLKPTFVDLALGSGMLIGLAMGKSPIRLIVGDTLSMSEDGWRTLTLRFGIFFLALAAINLVLIQKFVPDAVWFAFRFPGALIISLLFAATQMPMMIKDAKALETAARLSDTQP
jgi:intracellular septation protein